MNSVLHGGGPICRLLENSPRHLALGGFATRRQCVTLCSSGAKVTGPIKGPFSLRSSTENKFRLHMHTTNAKTSRATVLYTKASKAITQCRSFELPCESRSLALPSAGGKVSHAVENLRQGVGGCFKYGARKHSSICCLTLLPQPKAIGIADETIKGRVSCWLAENTSTETGSGTPHGEWQFKKGDRSHASSDRRIVSKIVRVLVVVASYCV